MRKTLSLLILTLAPIVCGCFVQTIGPTYTDDQLVTNPDFVGDWAFAEEGSTASFSIRESGDGYLMTVTDSVGTTGSFDVHLARMADYLFADLFPVEIPEINESDYEHRDVDPASNLWIVRGHVCFVIDDLAPDMIAFRSLIALEDEDSPFAEFDRETLDIVFDSDIEALVISPAEMQEILLQNIESEDMWWPTTLVRMQESEPTQAEPPEE